MLKAVEIDFHGVKIKGFETKLGFVENDTMIKEGFKNLHSSARTAARHFATYNDDRKFIRMLNSIEKYQSPISEEEKLKFRTEFIPYMWERMKKDQDASDAFLDLI